VFDFDADSSAYSLPGISTMQDASKPQDREKRKLAEATFQSKNAVLGFIFGVSCAQSLLTISLVAG